jgi:hypothetical protein
MESGNASQAYRHAYNTKNMKPESVNRTAFELLNSRKIASRVERERERMARQTELSQADVVKMLTEDRALARELGQSAAAVAASVHLAKLAGLYVERSDTTTREAAPSDSAPDHSAMLKSLKALGERE